MVWFVVKCVCVCVRACVCVCVVCMHHPHLHNFLLQLRLLGLELGKELGVVGRRGRSVLLRSSKDPLLWCGLL